MKTGRQNSGIGRAARAMALAALAMMTLAACGTEDPTEVPEPPMLVLDDPLSFEGIVGESREASFEVTNEGDDDVTYEVVEGPAWLDIESATGTLGAGTTQSVEVGVTCPDEPSDLEGTVVLEADDFGFSVGALLNCQAMEPGSLSVDVQGLPEGWDARIDVVGPQGFEAEVEASEDLEDLVPGEYRIYAFKVGDDVIYSPEPEEALVEVEAGEESTASFNYELVTGGLEVWVSGLPEDAEPTIEVIDPDGESQPVQDGDVLEDLEPGTYQVIPEPFEGDDAIYEASAMDVEVFSAQVAQAEIQYLVDTGILDVEVIGLPDGVDHAIEVIDSDGNAVSLPQSGQLTALEAGTYDLVPGEVEDGLATYEAEAQEVIIEIDQTTGTTVEYEATDGELPVVITGLNGVNADVALEGDSGDFTVTETTTLTLEPGTYDVVATDVTVNGTTYAVSGAPTMVDVSSGDNDALEIDYELVLGDLEVVVDGLNGIDGDVVVSGPDGFEETIMETTSFSELVPGEYTAIAQTVTDGLREFAGDSASLELASGDDEVLTVSYAVVPAEVEVQVSGLPGGVNADISIAGPDDTLTPTETTSYTDLTPGSFGVTANDVSDLGTTYEVVSAPASVDLASGSNDPIEISYEVVTASLEVVVEGLDGLDADVVVTGPDGFEESLTETGTLQDLVPGEYVVTANEVSDNGVDYTADGATLNLDSDVSEMVTISYDAVPGDVEVQISGLGDGVDADVAIMGPEDTLEPTETTSYTDLAPGTYEVEANDVSDGGVTYEVASAPESVELGSGDNDPIEITYEVVTGDINMTTRVYDGLAFEVTLEGPDGFSEAITDDSSFSDVVPGEYSLSVTDAPTDGEANEPYVAFEQASFELASGETVSQEIVVAPGHLVTRGEDEGVGTLRDRVAEVLEDTVIEFSPAVTMVTVGDQPIMVEQSLVIDGGDASAVTLDGGDDGRLMEIADPVNVALSGMTLTGGSTVDDGGALYIGGSAMVDAQNLRFEANFAEGGGGAVYVTDEAMAFFSESVFEGNSVDGGGAALAVGSTATSAIVEIEKSLIDTNQGLSGGALTILGSGDLRVAQSTVVNNQSDTNSSAISATGGSAEVLGTTIVGNTGAVAVSSETSMTLRGNIIADNADGDVGGDASNYADAGYNVIGVGAAGFQDGEEGNQVGSESEPLDPMLLALADNGGPTMTKKPEMGVSPADGAIPASACYGFIEIYLALWGQDQRGERRPAGASCTAGAYEFDSEFESFDNADMSRGSYNDGFFDGDLGLTWEYFQVRRQSESEGNDYVIDGESLILDGGRDSWIRLSDVPEGIDSFSLQFAQAFTNNNPRQVELVINGNVVATSEDAMVDTDEFDAPYPVYTFEVDGLDVQGDFDLEIRVPSSSSQVVIDNLSFR